MIKKFNLTNVLLFFSIIFQFYLYSEVKTDEKSYKSVTTENLKIVNSLDSLLISLNDSASIYFYNRNGNKVLVLGQIGDGYKNASGGIEIYDGQDSMITSIDGRVIGIYNSKGKHSFSAGRDMENNGFIALFDSLGQAYLVNRFSE